MVGFHGFFVSMADKISFQGSENADYFAEHYRSIGYTVSFEEEEDLFK